MILIKYKPTYIVTVNGEELGYVEDQSEFEEIITEKILQYTGKNVYNVSLNVSPEYELKLVNRTENTNEDEIIVALQEEAIITYKYFEVTLNDESKINLDTMEEAESLVTEIKSLYEDVELDLKISEVETQSLDEVEIQTLEVAKESLNVQAQEIVDKIEEEKLPSINGIKIAVTPVSGTISSRFGGYSRLRVSTHTGLDIAASSGTSIKVIADGTVTYASYNGSYGNIVKVDHGNGVESWYAHCSKIYTSVGSTVSAGDVIAAVGSTGNSTGPHLHLEIRIDGEAVNPQNYLYN